MAKTIQAIGGEVPAAVAHTRGSFSRPGRRFGDGGEHSTVVCSYQCLVSNPLSGPLSVVGPDCPPDGSYSLKASEGRNLYEWYKRARPGLPRVSTVLH